MKTRTLNSLAAAAMGLAMLVLLPACSRSTEQAAADAKTAAGEAKQDVKDAATDAQAGARTEWLEFKSAAEARIAENDRLITEYKARMTAADGKLKKEYNQGIDSLEVKNTQLKARLNAYQDSGADGWASFKSEVGHDLDGLGTALKNFVVDNTK